MSTHEGFSLGSLGLTASSDPRDAARNRLATLADLLSAQAERSLDAGDVPQAVDCTVAAARALEASK